MRDWLQPDRAQNRRLSWFLADIVVAALFIWITVESLRSDAYVDEYGAIEGWGWALAISPTVVLLVRRFVPATALLVASALYMLASGWQGDSNAPLAIPFFAYSVGLTRPVPVSAALVGTAAVAVSSSVFYGPGDPVVLSVPVTVMLFGIGWLVAVSIRRNETRAAVAVDAAQAVRAEAEHVAEQAVIDERARIARELHDAVGHAVNVMVMQAGAARISAQDERTTETLREIERVGRSALTDLDHMLGLLHDDRGKVAPLEPARSTADIARLVEEMRAGGADVALHDDCGTALSGGEHAVGTAAYRIVQEALTNAIKHAGPARIEVFVSCTDQELQVRVLDDGRGAGAVASGAGGRGIAGMTARAAALGGRLTARPGATSGFIVEARIPRSNRSHPAERARLPGSP